MIKFELHRNFEKQYKKLGRDVQEKFKIRRNLFLKYPTAPILRTHPLVGNRKGQWSINITGDIRAIFEYKDQDTIIFVDIGTHNDLYGK